MGCYRDGRITKQSPKGKVQLASKLRETRILANYQELSPEKGRKTADNR